MLLMKEAGCRLLIAGFESGNQNVLNAMHKGIKLDWSKRYVENVQKSRLVNSWLFYVGNPGEPKKLWKKLSSLL